jgi:hypothetical protein
MKNPNRFHPRVEEMERRLVPSTLVNSSNWSGYAVSTSAGAVTQVSGSWVVPTVATNVSGYSSAWVGIDGFSSSTVEQTGTDSDYVNGQAQYYAWYEMYPAGFVKLNLAINPGDTMSASVSNTSPGQFVLYIKDVNTGKSSTTTQTSSKAQQSSAEWILEAPSSISGVLPLANFGSINFSGAKATISGTTGPADNSWSGTTLYQIDMATRRTLEATTSALTDSGSPLTSGFSVTWDSSGSGGGGGGHKHSNNVPLPLPPASLTTALLSPALAGLLTNPQVTPPALVANPSPTMTVPLSAAVALPTLPALSAVTATFAPIGPDIASSGGEAAGQLPLSAGPTVPVNAGAAPQADSLATPQTDLTPTDLPGASLAMGPATDAVFAEGFWLPAASLEVAEDAFSGED